MLSGQADAPVPLPGGDQSEKCIVYLSRFQRAGLARYLIAHPGGRDHRPGRRERSRQDDPGETPGAAL